MTKKIIVREFMRLYNTYYICKKNIDKIKGYKLNLGKDGLGNVYYDFANWVDFNESLNELYSVDSLKLAVKNVYNIIPIINRDITVPRISSNLRESFIKDSDMLVAKMNAIIDLYESTGNGDTGVGVDIKIPECKELKEYINYLKELDFIFTQCPFLSSKEESIKFNTVDVGSIWLTFAVVSGTSFYILNNIAKLVDKALSIKSNIIVYKQQQEQLYTMKAKNKASDEVISVFESLKDMILKDAVTSLEEDINVLNDGEERDKTAKCLEKLTLLIDKGVEIYSSIESPSEIKVLFPMQESQTLLSDDIMKLLESKKV